MQVWQQAAAGECSVAASAKIPLAKIAALGFSEQADGGLAAAYSCKLPLQPSWETSTAGQAKPSLSFDVQYSVEEAESHPPCPPAEDSTQGLALTIFTKIKLYDSQALTSLASLRLRYLHWIVGCASSL